MKIIDEIVPSDELKDAMVDYLKCISSDVEDDENDVEDSTKEIVELHVKRDELLLRGGSTNYNPNDPQASCHAQLLEMGRQRRVNTIHNRLEDMRENIRNMLELNQKLEAMVEQQKRRSGFAADAMVCKQHRFSQCGIRRGTSSRWIDSRRYAAARRRVLVE
ncbi:hypothetical protein M3Y94_00188100 [Aphelenchoides besseyi]|nr:hypothetical protein M3Y94_00188100 [Aphelenchoides besseyi]